MNSRQKATVLRVVNSAVMALVLLPACGEETDPVDDHSREVLPEPALRIRAGTERAYLFTDSDYTELLVQQLGRAVMIEVPSGAPDPISSVVVVEYVNPGS